MLAAAGVNVVALQTGSKLREWSPLLYIVAMAGAVIPAYTDGFRGAAFYWFGVMAGLALSTPLVLGLAAIVAVHRRRRGKPAPEPPTRVFGAQLAELPSGRRFYPRPLWLRLPSGRDRVEVDAGVVEVERGRGRDTEEMLARDPSSFPRPSTRWHVVYETGDPTWPALVVHDGLAECRVIARASSVELAERLAFLATATYNERHRLVRSPRYWFRVPL